MEMLSRTIQARTILRAEDVSVGYPAAQFLASTILSLCNSSKTNFEDPDFGPELTERGQDLEEEINMTLKKQLSDAAYQSINKTFTRAEARRSKCLTNISGPSGPVPSDLKWVANSIDTSFVVSADATPSFPVQGSVGDCWLLGAMSMVAICRPKLLQEIFVCPTGDWASADKRSRHGAMPMSARDVYVVRLFYELKWHYVVIDGRVPRGATSSGRPTFARCADSNEMWVSLIEKAAAKLAGGYDKLHMAGTVDFGVHMLTGCSTHTIRCGGFQSLSTGTSEEKEEKEDTTTSIAAKLIKNETSKSTRNAMYAQIQQYLEAGFLLGCERQQRLGTTKISAKSPSAKAAFTDEDGMLLRHAYVVLDVSEVNGTRLVRLINPWMVNPWPTGQFHGAWSRTSDEAKENASQVSKSFGEKIRRSENNQMMQQYVPSYNPNGKNNTDSDLATDDDNSDTEEQSLQDSTGSERTPLDFLMSFDHFVETMSHVHVGFVNPLDPKSWTICSVQGTWAGKVGGCAMPNNDLDKWSRNPRYKLNVPELNVTDAERERRKRSQLNKKTNVTNVIVSVRQSLSLSFSQRLPLDKKILGMRFVPCGKSNVPTIIQNTVPGRPQPYHVEGTGATSVSLNLKCDTSMDIVPDNYKIGKIAEFLVTAVSYRSTIDLKRASVLESGKQQKTTSQVSVAVDRSIYNEKDRASYDSGAIPYDRVPPSNSNVLRVIRKKRERDHTKMVEIEKKDWLGLKEAPSALTGSSSTTNSSTQRTTSVKQAPKYTKPPDEQFEDSLHFWKNKRLSGSSGNSGTVSTNTTSGNKLSKGNSAPPPSYKTVLKKKDARGGSSSTAAADAADINALPPPPAYTRVVVSPERAALRDRIQQSLLESPPAKGNAPTKKPYFGAIVDMEEESHCAVVFRGGLMMETIDLSPASKLNGLADIKTTAFVLCTVQEIVHPYALIFSVEHPGSRTSASRKFDLKNLEAMLTAPLSMSSAMTANPEAVEAVDKWFDTGVLPRHDHLATWLASQMNLDLGGGGIRTECIDGPIDNGMEDEDDAEDGDNKQDYVLHDVVGAEQASIASSWADEEEEANDRFENGGGAGDESFAPDEWGDAEGGDQNIPNDENSESGGGGGGGGGDGHYNENPPDSGARLPDSDPFVLASLHAGAVLKELQEKDQYRKRVAKVREEVILQRARRLRAATEYQRDVSRLQHKEIGKAIMRQTVAVGVASTLKKSDVQDEKRKRELRRITNPFKQNPSEKWIKGPNLGEGPLPSRTLDAPRQRKRLLREKSKYAYDAHGRRLPRKLLGKSRTGPPVEAALNKLRDAAMDNSMHYLEIRELFDRFDIERNNYLSRAEMVAAVKSLGIETNEKETNALIDHFDANGNGKIHYSEFSFAFFNRRGLINKWRMVRGPGMRSEAAIMSIFRKYDFDGSGKLEKDEFERCLVDMGIVLPPLEFQILAERFDTDKDGFVQPKEFLAFMKKLEESSQKQRKEHREKITSNNTLLDEVRQTAEASQGASGTSLHPTIKALQDKIKAQEEEIETLERFMSKRK
jgi:Ca2+-binding EF-hand superfamily protein